MATPMAPWACSWAWRSATEARTEARPQPVGSAHPRAESAASMAASAHGGQRCRGAEPDRNHTDTPQDNRITNVVSRTSPSTRFQQAERTATNSHARRLTPRRALSYLSSHRSDPHRCVACTRTHSNPHAPNSTRPHGARNREMPHIKSCHRCVPVTFLLSSATRCWVPAPLWAIAAPRASTSQAPRSV